MQADGVDAEAAAFFQSVRAEAARIPHVCAGPRLNPEEESAVSCATESASAPAAPLLDWTCTVVDNFVAARAQVAADAAAPRGDAEASLPNVMDRRGWLRYMHRDEAKPFSTTLACMDNLLACACLKSLAEEASEGAALSAHTGLWMYGLLVRLEKPVHPNVACVLRQVAVMANEGRQRLPETPEGRDTATEVAMYDTLRVLAGGFFGQDSSLAPVVADYLRRSGQL